MNSFVKGALTLAVGTFVAAAVAVVATHKISFLTQAERTLADFRIATTLRPEPQDPNIVIVGITEDTLALFPYREPVDRAFLAGLLKTLEARKPRLVAVDVLFDQPTEPAKDAALKAIIAGYTVPLAISYTDTPGEVNTEQLRYLNDFVPPDRRVRADLSEDPVDGVVRTIFPGKRNADGTYTFGFARGVVARLGIQTPAVARPMSWHGRPDIKTPPFRMFPAHLVKLLPADWFRDKVVLVGGIFSLRDRHRTPFSNGLAEGDGDLPGIEVHAHAVAQLLEGRSPLELSRGRELLLVGLLSVLGTLLGRLNLGLVRHLTISGLTLVVLWPVAFALSYYARVMVPLVEPSIGFLLAVWGTDAFSGREARRQKEFINSAFTRYLNPQLVKQLSSDPARLTLGGEARDMTLLFCDIRGFTTISEQFDAQGLTRLINRFLTPMTDVILQNQGTIDKYMGDCIMAFWNAPLDDPNHAANACRSALLMMKRLAPLNAELEDEAKAEGRRHVPIKVGIGVNSGEAVVGNMGSNQRFDYSVLGDNVNLASRLEGQSKTYGVTAVVGENTQARAPTLAYLELDRIKVKGKTEAVRIFALLGDEELAADAAFRALAGEHEAMLAAYRSQDWTRAEQRLDGCRGFAGDFHLDNLYQLYQERIAGYRAAPPPAAWDGVYVALTK